MFSSGQLVENLRRETLIRNKETHLMRFFFPLELNCFLESAGFTSIHFGTFPEFDKDPDETTWNVLAVARAV